MPYTPDEASKVDALSKQPEPMGGYPLEAIDNDTIVKLFNKLMKMREAMQNQQDLIKDLTDRIDAVEFRTRVQRTDGGALYLNLTPI